MVGIDCQAVDYAPSWSTSRRSLRSLARAAAFAAARFRPDVVYGHEMRGAVASILGVRGVPLVADFHSAGVAVAIRAAAHPAAPTLASVGEQVHERLRWDRLAREVLGVLRAAAEPSP